MISLRRIVGCCTGIAAATVDFGEGYRCGGVARFEVCYYKMGYAAREESRVQQPTGTVNRGAQAGSENDIAVVRDSTACRLT